MANKPLPRKQRVLNRGYLYSRKDDNVKSPSVTLMDVDSAIVFYFENVIRPSVLDNGENISILESSYRSRSCLVNASNTISKVLFKQRRV